MCSGSNGALCVHRFVKELGNRRFVPSFMSMSAIGMTRSMAAGSVRLRGSSVMSVSIQVGTWYGTTWC
jgi:hypothetical protein